MEIMIIPGTLVSVVGIVFIIIGFAHKSIYDTSHKDWITVKGQIIRFKTHRNMGGKKIFTPVVLFYTTQGQQFYCEGYGTQLSTYNVNQFVQVDYNPINPSQSQIKNDSGKRIFRFIFWGVGSMMVLMGVIFGCVAFISYISRFIK